VKNVWRLTRGDIAYIRSHPYYGDRSLKVVAHVIPTGGRREDAFQMELFVRATPTQWAQFVEGRDAHIAAARARLQARVAAAPPGHYAAAAAALTAAAAPAPDPVADEDPC
jgi:hypothetical protein